MTSIDTNDFLNERPELWSRKQVVDWINWCTVEYALHDIPISKFEMNGKALCMLTEDMFKQRVPNSGDILYRALKNLLLPDHQQQHQQQDKQQQNYQKQVNSDSSGAGSTTTTKSSTNTTEFDKLICAQNTQINIAQSNNSTTNQTSTTTDSLNSNTITNNKKSKLDNSYKLETDKIMKPNLTSDITSVSNTTNTTSTKSPLTSTNTSSLLLQKTTSKFLPFDSNNNYIITNNDNEMTSNLDEDEEDDDDLNKNESTTKLTISSASSTTSTTPYANLNTNSPNYERKRTANLENLIGNLKVRKLNQSTNKTNQSSSSTNTKMTSLYVDIGGSNVVGGGAQSLSDCSPSTPPLSSPSVSPSSLSIASDSPMHVSSSFSSSSSSLVNQADKLRYSSLLPKFRWIVESENPLSTVTASLSSTTTTSTTMPSLDETQLKSVEAAVAAAAQLGFDPMKLNEIINDPQQWCQQQQTDSAKTTTKSRLNKSKDKQTRSSNSSNNTTTTNNKNQEDPTRQIKFYDDFIDFRGDVLRRPPDSKNCRILWEYLYLLLQNPNYTSVIRWEDEANMVFRIVQAEKLAALWGLQKNRLGMTYEKLSRGMRYYYPNNIIAREPGRRLLYRFMRHPDEIKKFVKKNGTYMLKRAKLGANGNSLGANSSLNLDESLRNDFNPDDSGVDEPLNGPTTNTKQSNSKKTKNENNNSSKKNHSKLKTMSNSNNNNKQNDNQDEYPDEELDEDEEDLDEEIEEDEDLSDDVTNNQNNTNEDLDQQSSITSSPYSGISQKSTNLLDDNKLTIGEMKTNTQQQQHQHQTAAAALLAAAANAMNANRLYQDFYSPHDLLQYYAAAAANLQHQQTLTPQIASNYFSRQLKQTQSDDMNAAQLLIQLCNQQQQHQQLNDNHYMNETIKNLTRNISNQNSINLNMSSSPITTTTTTTPTTINSTQTNTNKSKRASVARSNDLSSASSTSSNSSLEHSIDYETNDFNTNSTINKHKSKQIKSERDYNEYPLNLSITNNNNNNIINSTSNANSNKKRKSKYDIQVNGL